MGQVSSVTNDAGASLYLKSPSRLYLSSLTINGDAPGASISQNSPTHSPGPPLLTITNDKKTGISCKSHTKRLVEFVQVRIGCCIAAR
jgi:hypothetical protein